MAQHTVKMSGRSEPIQVGKIICIGRNYVDHIKELNNERPASPMFFIKPATALSRLEEPIRLPAYSKKVRHELELAVLIKSPLRHCQEQ